MTDRVLLRLHAPLRAATVHRPLAGAESPGPVAERLRALDLRAVRERDEHEALLKAARAIVAAAGAARAEVSAALAALAGHAVELGLAVAREVIGDAAMRGDVDPLAAVLSCLEAAAGSGPQVEICLAPADLDRVMSRIAADPELRARTHGCAFSADPALGCGQVQARSGLRRIAHDPREVFERVALALRKAGQA